MAVNLRGRNFLTLKDFTPEEIRYMLDLSLDLKRKKRAGVRGDLLDRRNIVLLFEKASTRTRCAFETAAFDEGGSVTFLTNSQMGKKESIEDTAKVLGRFYDGIEFRGFKQETVATLAEHAGVPVWNGLTDLYHPTQILADFLTVMEHCHKPLNKVKFVYAGDARNNMGNSLMIGAAKMGMHFVALAPKELFPSEELVAEMNEIAKETGAVIELSESLDAVKGADVIYTDVWVSMGEEAMFEQRIKQLRPYQVNMDMIKKTGNDDVLFLHCLPAFHDLETEVGMDIKEKFGLDSMEVTDEVFRSKHSVVFDEAENRMHTIKAVMVATIGNL
ncbi:MULTISPECIES: ornithine carbamoyltransferase [unclassified Oceanispirochaeta]|uniref:ornithine carbamoyltransferase n=1 Tax=unclassified Oceanispirochaeta TaxID=2635722 RepID=UPI000E093B3E|nr:MULTISPECIES: ornithine carbamoyltransferase [unclassified Oceanispirochaeta]MBF9015824.1 ornithine carbamoyltransferase [Oceanispirochaeta sp. M2]NPD72287.1 ornithine carbamoyltransferase [Oceanispirochaeta sp. M1]RDG32380.1 ornithine carbamoyltransferase [Oceanispirochaeta sp. M1]